MGANEIASKIEGAIQHLSENPDDARYTDSAATARLEDDLRCVVTGPDGASIATDMTPGIGGRGEHPSPGWLWRAATASCTATVIGMRAAQQGIDVGNVEVTVDSESDDRGILGMDSSVPAGPLSIRVRVKIDAAGVDAEKVRELAGWGSDHCPVCEGAKRAIPVNLEVETA